MEDELPSFEDEMAGIRARAADARDAARLEPVLAGAGGQVPGMPDVQGAATALANGPAGAAARGLENVVGWVKKLPRNLSLGLLDAAKHTARSALDAMDTVGENMTIPNDSDLPDPNNPGMTYRESQVLRQRQANDETPGTDLDALYANWRNTLRTDDDMADAVTQGAAQFMIPFSAWAKAARVGQGSVLLPSLAAEAATSATAFDPHDGRLADLIDLGKHSEGKFGELLRTAVPDGSAQNAYIDYMTDRSNETDAEGRFKNVIDNSVASLALAGMLKGSATILKNGKAAIQNAPEVIGNAQLKGPRAKQQGKIVFHGSPHEVQQFDTGKIGTGEGQQVYGYGLYFAEAKDVANTYRGSNDIVHRIASASMYKHKNDWQAAVADLKARGDNRSAAAARALEKGKGKLTGGNLYSVDVPDEIIGKMMNWDKPMSQQTDVLGKIPQDVKQNLEDMLDQAGFSPDLEALDGKHFYKLLSKAVEQDRLPFYPEHGNYDNYDRIASEYLDSIGVPGIKFLDGASRGKGEGTRNLVVFNDKNTKVVGKE